MRSRGPHPKRRDIGARSAPEEEDEFGGHFWVYLQYAHALRRLGCDVFWLERFSRDAPRGDASDAVSTFFRRMERYGLGGRAILYETAADGAFRFIGVSPA